MLKKPKLGRKSDLPTVAEKLLKPKTSKPARSTQKANLKQTVKKELVKKELKEKLAEKEILVVKKAKYEYELLSIPTGAIDGAEGKMLKPEGGKWGKLFQGLLDKGFEVDKFAANRGCYEFLFKREI